MDIIIFRIILLFKMKSSESSGNILSVPFIQPIQKTTNDEKTLQKIQQLLVKQDQPHGVILMNELDTNKFLQQPKFIYIPASSSPFFFPGITIHTEKKQPGYALYLDNDMVKQYEDHSKSKIGCDTLCFYSLCDQKISETKRIILQLHINFVSIAKLNPKLTLLSIDDINFIDDKPYLTKMINSIMDDIVVTEEREDAID
jgi:hypothetical protein